MRPTQRCVFFFNRQALEWPQESVPNYDGFVSELVEYSFNDFAVAARIDLRRYNFNGDLPFENRTENDERSSY